jgi:DNA-binding GntR family transcriptional regulator
MGGPSLRELPSASLADRAHAAIRAAITSGELSPGERVTERDLAARLSVSATPVREAFRRLEQEGLLERRGSRSTVVAAAGDSERHELALIEAALKGVALRLAAVNAGADEIERMERHLDEADLLRAEMRRAVAAGEDYPTDTAEMLLLALRSFHVEAEAACGNAVLLRMLSTVDVFSFRARAASLESRVTSGELLDDRYDEHRRMLDAIRRRDPGAAERLMADHARYAAARYPAPTLEETP